MIATQKQAAPAAKALELAHRIAWRYKKSSDPAHSDTFTFNESTLLQFVGALAQQAVPEGFALVQVDALTRWRDAFAEELAAYDIDPPIHHVKTSHDEIAAVLAAAPRAEHQAEREPLTKPAPRPGQLWRYNHHGLSTLFVVRGQQLDGNWLLHGFHWIDADGEYMAARGALFNDRDFEDADFIGRVGIGKESAAAQAEPECTRSHPHEDMGEACQRKTEEARSASAARQASRPLCRDCADFGPICPNSGLPCGGTDAAPRAEQRAGQAPSEGAAEPVGAVLVNKETREGVMFYSADMLPDPATLKDRFELVKVYTHPTPVFKPSAQAEQAPAVAPWVLTGEQLDSIRQALLDTAKDPHDIDEADRIVERILSSFKPPVQGAGGSNV